MRKALSVLFGVAALNRPALCVQSAANAQERPRSFAVAVEPESLELLEGNVLGGTLLDLGGSDDSYLSLQASNGCIELQLGAACPGTPSGPPSRLEFVLESQVQPELSDAVQILELRDFEGGGFELIDSRFVAPGLDRVTRVSWEGNVRRFVQPATRRMLARLSYEWSAYQSEPTVSLDHAGWAIHRTVQHEFVDLRGYDAPSLNTGADFIRTVFDLGPDRMLGTPDGVQLSFDVSAPGPYDYTFRSELRETDISSFPAPNSSQAYRMQFDLDELPDLYGPMTIFQRFNRDLDGPDIGVELTGANQFSNAVPNDLQVVAFGQRLRLGKMLRPKNDLLVVIHNHPNGKYKVSLNGETLHQATGIDTLASTQGSWSQFGLYPHGLHDDQNRADQIASGFTRVSFVYSHFEKLSYEGVVDLEAFGTRDPN